MLKMATMVPRRVTLFLLSSKNVLFARASTSFGNQSWFKSLSLTHNHNILCSRYQMAIPHPRLEDNTQVSRYMTTKPNLVQECWKCGTELDPKSDQYFCTCGVVQPPKFSRNYFNVMEMDTQFDIDTTALKHTFTRLQSHLHPDKFTQKTETEKEFSLQQSSTLNKAYSTLLKPLSRGLYLLELHGQSLEENDIHADPKFLMEIMDINEELAEADTLEAINEIGDTNQKVLDELISKLAEAFDREDISQAKELLGRLKYYANIDEKVKNLQILYAEKI